MKGSECASVQRLLALRPTDWNEDERRQAAAHLAVCAQCERLFRVHAAQDRALQSIPTARLDTAAWERLRARLAPERQWGTVRPQAIWALGAVALVVVALVAGLALLPGKWLGSAAGDTPTIGPTQILMPSPTITPTTVLTPTPIGDVPASAIGGVVPYTPQASLWPRPNPIAFCKPPDWPRAAVGP